MPLAVLLDHIIRIVSMVAPIAATAMTGFIKRMCDVTFPLMVLQAVRLVPVRTARQTSDLAGGEWRRTRD